MIINNSFNELMWNNPNIFLDSIKYFKLHLKVNHSMFVKSVEVKKSIIWWFETLDCCFIRIYNIFLKGARDAVRDRISNILYFFFLSFRATEIFCIFFIIFSGVIRIFYKFRFFSCSIILLNRTTQFQYFEPLMINQILK